MSDIYDIYCICQQIKVKNTSFLINFENMYLTNCHKRDFNIVYINIILNQYALNKAILKFTTILRFSFSVIFIMKKTEY
ncbi:MAG: hypothetical protein HFE57_06075 [Firmicutes bacterium]|nr:hypothetical protein [Bacillota bacterium]